MEQETEVLPNMDVNEAQLDKFFETGGELPAEEVTQEEAPAVENDSQPEEPQAVSEAKDKTDKVVPYGALHEERERRKELQRTVADEQARVRKLEEAFQKVLERQNSNPAPVPNYEDDPTEALRVKTEQLERTLQNHNQTLTQQQQQAENQRQYGEFVDRYAASAQAYKAENPEFAPAYNHLMQTRLDELIAMGYNQAEAVNIRTQDEIAIAAKAYADGVNPGERLYALAKMRGFSQAQPQAQAPIADAAQKLDQLEKGLNASKSLSNASGQATTELTLEALASMEDADFDKAWEKVMKGVR